MGFGKRSTINQIGIIVKVLIRRVMGARNYEEKIFFLKRRFFSRQNYVTLFKYNMWGVGIGAFLDMH